MRKGLLEFLGQAREWGVSLVEAKHPPQEQLTSPTGERFVEVYRRSESGETVIGHLSQEEGEFVFRYDPQYAGRPISAFPSKHEEYRSKFLWPFFTVRVPPFSRPDMEAAMKRHSLDENQIIEILGLITKASISNPYEFRLNPSLPRS
ncbi:MAG: HipA N-terminal domain-containing protein [Aestuariivita sp.]|nr:HipA N-terminal domain-containing protein [Aestuariivita sp.]